ncbi:MAG TPA: ABC transporter permease [Candidatus Limnocylindria bacterium]|nr:ABC transporter permease [Candidatus Limnocylindria bacterium]
MSDVDVAAAPAAPKTTEARNEPPHAALGRLDRSPLWQLTWTRTLAFLREPEAVFWVFAFPVLLSLALGIAFRNQGPQKLPVAVQAGPRDVELQRALSSAPELEVTRLDADEAQVALRRGKIAVLVRGESSGPPTLVFDPSRPETRLAQQLALDALERAAGRVDRVRPTLDTQPRPGGRYIDFLIPGLIGLNLLGTGMWGIGFPIANARQQKLLKRLIATPMRRSHYLLSLMLARMTWLLLEVVAILGFGQLVFDVQVRGSWTAFMAVTLLGAFAFSTIGLLVACRARTIEAVSGLMNVAMLPMWLLSGSFFSADRFPQVMQPFIRALPLTATNDALRLIMNEGASLSVVTPQLVVLTAWTIVSFFVALWLFRWE